MPIELGRTIIIAPTTEDLPGRPIWWAYVRFRDYHECVLETDMSHLESELTRVFVETTTMKQGHDIPHSLGLDHVFASDGTTTAIGQSGRNYGHCLTIYLHRATLCTWKKSDEKLRNWIKRLSSKLAWLSSKGGSPTHEGNILPNQTGLFTNFMLWQLPFQSLKAVLSVKTI